LLASSLDYRVTLVQVVRLAVPCLADWCSVEVVNDEGVVDLFEVAHVDPEKVQLARALREKDLLRHDAFRGVDQVMRTGQPKFVPKVTDDMLVRRATDEEHLRIL